MKNNIINLLIVALGGWSGIHKFIEKKKGIGFLYLFTFGLFGFGWIFDTLKAFIKCFSISDLSKSNTSSVKQYAPTATTSETVEPKIKIDAVDYMHLDKYKKSFIAFDLETTGLNAAQDKIIEISAVVFKDFVPCETFTTLVNPGMPIPASASKINHIYDADVAEAPAEFVAMKNFCQFIGQHSLNSTAILVAHNASFDAKFLTTTLKRCSITHKFIFHDTLNMCRQLNLGLKNNKLGTIAKHFGITQTAAHRAEDDARVCGEIFVKLLQF